MTMTISAGRQVYVHDAAAPPATAIGTSVFVAVRGVGGRLLLVRRCGSDTWEFPGGRLDPGETAAAAAVRQTVEDTGVHVLVTGIVALFSDPGIVVSGPDHVAQQQLAVLFRARALGDVPHPDQRRTSEAAWIAVRDLPRLPVDPPTRDWIADALANESVPFIE